MKSRLASLVLPALLVLSACREDGTGPTPTPDSIELDLPASTSDGRSFTLTVTAIGPNGERPYAGASGTLQLSVSSGSVTPATAEMSGGRATLTAQVSGANGDITLTAALDEIVASGTLRVAAGEDRLSGDPAGPATAAIPDEPFVPRAQDYSDTHPDLPGLFMSFNTLLLAFEPGTSVDEANGVLDSLNAEIVGGITGTNQLPGILFLRLPTATHAAMSEALATLEADARVRVATPDVLLGTTEITRPNGGTPASWTWDVAPGGGNWGLERSRVPQMWNLNAAIVKAGGSVPVTAVLDAGFEVAHPDLIFKTHLNPGVRHRHGAHVAGTIGATFDNGIGVDGVNPFASMVVLAPNFSGSSITLVSRASAGGTMISGYYDLVRSDPTIRVVNTSLGYNWHRFAIDSDNSLSAQRVANAQGLILSTVHSLLADMDRLPVLVTAAGNETMKNARFASPMANAALAHGDANIIVVEAVADAPGSAGDATRSPFSNINGHLSAPGSAIMSAVLIGSTYDTLSGTSMATPHVAGVVGYLYTLDPTLPRPTLASNPVRDLLLANAVPVAGGAQSRMDAFATVLSVDGMKGNNRVLHMLLDIDDGSEDGNLRQSAGGGVIVEEDADSDGGPGDGTIDMSDFRRWRDWLLQLENAATLSLDGGASHPKRDLNGDGQLDSPADELIFPRGDFNGDGVLHRVLSGSVPGFASPVTDLEVLQHLFDDSHYQASELPALIESADLHINASHCLSQTGVAAVVTAVELRGTGSTVEERNHSTDESSHIYTVGAAPATGTGYLLKAQSLDASGQVIATAEQDTTLHLGSDVHWRPVCVTGPFHGTWYGEVTFQMNGTSSVDPLTLVLIQTNSSVTGTWSLASGLSGVWTGTASGTDMSFVATLTLPTSCSGSGSGTLTLGGVGMEGGGSGSGTCEGNRSFTFTIGNVSRTPPG